jgi:diguanylate cyclase (GGDEF)-like protein
MMQSPGKGEKINKDTLITLGVEEKNIDQFLQSDAPSTGFITGSLVEPKFYYVEKGDNILHLKESQPGVTQFLNRSYRNFLYFLLALTTFVVIVVFAMAKMSFAPLSELRRTTEDILAGRFEVKMRYTAKDELGRMFQALRRLCGELESREKDLEKVSELAKKDGMTGLLNHRTFKEEFRKMLNTAQSKKTLLSIALLDVDHFKKFNDTYGHAQGDEVLKAVARALQTNGPKESIIARYGGEEFVVIYPGLTFDNYIQGIDKLREAIEKTKVPRIDRNGEPLNVTASFGALLIDGGALPASQAQDAASMIDHYDQNLYAAKKQSRNKTIESL